MRVQETTKFRVINIDTYRVAREGRGEEQDIDKKRYFGVETREDRREKRLLRRSLTG